MKSYPHQNSTGVLELASQKQYGPVNPEQASQETCGKHRLFMTMHFVGKMCS